MSLDRPAPAGGHALPALSWPAIFAGAAAALAAALTLDLLGAGFGLALTSSWLQGRGSPSLFTPVSGACAVAAEVVALALGGYVAGRLRTDWVGVHADERHFRDTAHGLVVWAVTALVGGAFTALVVAPFAAAMAPAPTVVAVSGSPGAAALAAADLGAQAARTAHLAAQAAFFAAVGLFLGAFTAAVAAALGGMQRDDAAARDLG